MTETQVVVMSPVELERFVRETWDRAREEQQLPEVLDRAGVAALLGVSDRTVSTFVETEGLPAHKIGAQTLRFRRSEVLEWLSKRTADKGAA